MATSLNSNNLHSKSYANASKTNINAGTNTKFTAADFQRWNQTTSVVHIPSRLVRNSKIPQLRKELINAVGERKVSAVQALSPIKYNIQFKRSSDRHAAEINGIAFRGVQLTLLPAYEEVKSVFVEKAPLQMQDNYLFEALAPYGRVIGVQHLTIKEFPSVRSGTRRVSMVVTKAIPRTINIGGFPVIFNYRGQPTQCYVCQEVGHASKDCPKSRQGRKLQQQKQQQNLPNVTGKNKAPINNNKSKNKANNTTPALGHDDLKIKLDGDKRTVQTTQTRKRSPLGETDLRNKLNKKQGVVLKSSEPSPASKSLPTKSKAGRAKGQSLPKGESSVTDDVIVDEVARSPKAVAELMDTQPSQETSNAKISTSPPAKDLAELRKIFNIPAPSDDELEPGEIRDSSSIQSMDDERSSDHADPEIKLDGAVKAIQLTSEADSPLRVQSHSTSPPPLTQQITPSRAISIMPITSASESEEITEADFAASIIEAEQQAAAKSGPVRTAVRTVTTLRVRRRRSGLSQAKTPATITTTTTTSRSSSTITTSTWTKPTGGRAKVTGTQAEMDRDDIPLAVLRNNKRRKLDSSLGEELDYCLSGSSVVDPLAIEYWPTTPISSFGQTPSLPALEAPSATLDVAPQQQQQQQPAEDLPLAIPATAPVVTALDVARPEPEVTPDPMATPLGVLMQEEEEILIQVREEGEVFWASQVTSDLQGTPPLIGVIKHLIPSLMIAKINFLSCFQL